MPKTRRLTNENDQPKAPPLAASGANVPTLGVQEMADLLACDPRTVRDLASRGLLVKNGRDRYEVVRSIQRYVPHLRQEAARHGEGADNAVASREKAMGARALREMREMQRDRLAGTIVEIPEVESILGLFIVEVRRMIEELPVSMRFRLPHLTDDDVNIMKELADDILKEGSVRLVAETNKHPEIENLRKQGNSATNEGAETDE